MKRYKVKLVYHKYVVSDYLILLPKMQQQFIYIRKKIIFGHDAYEECICCEY